MNSFGLALANSVRKFTARQRLSVGLIFLLAAALRVVVAFWLPREIVWVDGERYVAVAQHLLEQHGFGGIVDNRLSVPTQPVLIAAVELVFGQSYLALRLFFAILGAATCVLGYLLAERLFDPVVAFIAGSLMAIYPYYVYLFALFEYPQPLHFRHGRRIPAALSIHAIEAC
jgi:4-amino-4-deoxy-L-arabinose transferase-like glycosyltransferase